MNAFLSFLPTLESAVALALLQAAWWGTLRGLGAAAVLAAMPRASAAARHATGLAFQVAMLLVPAWKFVALLAADTPAPAAAALPAFARGPGVAVDLAGALPSAWLASLWAAGVLVMLVRLAGGAWLVRSLGRLPAAPLPPVWEDRADALRRALG